MDFVAFLSGCHSAAVQSIMVWVMSEAFLSRVMPGTQYLTATSKVGRQLEKSCSFCSWSLSHQRQRAKSAFWANVSLGMTESAFPTNAGYGSMTSCRYKVLKWLPATMRFWNDFLWAWGSGITSCQYVLQIMISLCCSLSFTWKEAFTAPNLLHYLLLMFTVLANWLICVHHK